VYHGVVVVTAFYCPDQGVKIIRTDCGGSNKYVGVVEITSFPPEVEPMAANGSD